MHSLTSDARLALESAEPWLEKGYRVKIICWISNGLVEYTRMTVYDNGLPIVASLFQKGETFPGIIHT